MDEMSCASSMRSSRSLSINTSLETGKLVRCTESDVILPVTLFRSMNSLSMKKGAIGEARWATVSRQVYNVW